MQRLWVLKELFWLYPHYLDLEDIGTTPKIQPKESEGSLVKIEADAKQLLLNQRILPSERFPGDVQALGWGKKQKKGRQGRNSGNQGHTPLKSPLITPRLQPKRDGEGTWRE